VRTARIAESSRPVYQQLADSLRVKIATGELGPGEQVPTEKALAEEFGASRATIRQGLMVLVNEGLIVASRPRGYFVRRHERCYFRRPGPLHHTVRRVPRTGQGLPNFSLLIGYRQRRRCSTHAS